MFFTTPHDVRESLPLKPTSFPKVVEGQLEIAKIYPSMNFSVPNATFKNN